MSAPLRPSSIRTHDDTKLLPTFDVPLDVSNHERFRIQVVDRNIKEPLYLARMQVHRNDMVAPRHHQHVRNELRSDWSAGLVLLVHPRIGIARDDCGDAPRRGALARGDEDQQLHQVIVDVAAAGLDDEDVLVADGFGDLDVDLAVGEVLDGAWRQGDVEPGMGCKMRDTPGMGHTTLRCAEEVKVQLTAPRLPGQARGGYFLLN